jgi:hypothetical protein
VCYGKRASAYEREIKWRGDSLVAIRLRLSKQFLLDRSDRASIEMSFPEKLVMKEVKQADLSFRRSN